MKDSLSLSLSLLTYKISSFKLKIGITQSGLIEGFFIHRAIQIFTNGRDRHGGDRSLRLAVGRGDSDSRAGGVEGRARRRRRRRRARQQGLEVSTVSRQHALVRHELVLALVTDPHDRVGWRKRVLEAGVAAGPAAEPRSVQTVHRRAPFPLDSPRIFQWMFNSPRRQSRSWHVLSLYPRRIVGIRIFLRYTTIEEALLSVRDAQSVIISLFSFDIEFTNGNPRSVLIVLEHQLSRIFNTSDFFPANCLRRTAYVLGDTQADLAALCDLNAGWQAHHTVAHCYQLRVDTLAFSCRSSSTTYLPAYLLCRSRRVGLAQQPLREQPRTAPDERRLAAIQAITGELHLRPVDSSPRERMRS